jgi:hypothetical protein
MKGFSGVIGKQARSMYTWQQMKDKENVRIWKRYKAFVEIFGCP